MMRIYVEMCDWRFGYQESKSYCDTRITYFYELFIGPLHFEREER